MANKLLIVRFKLYIEGKRSEKLGKGEGKDLGERGDEPQKEKWNIWGSL